MSDLIRRKDVLALFPTNDCSDKMVGLYERVLEIPTAYNEVKTNADSIRNMTDEDLTDFMWHMKVYPWENWKYIDDVEKWLKAESEG